MNGVLTAGSGQQWESELVSTLERPESPMTVVRRCADLGEVIATASTGRARVAVVDGSLRRLDTDAVLRLRASGVAVIGIYPASDPRAKERLSRLGIGGLVADDAGPLAVLDAARLAILDLDRAASAQAGAYVADPRRALPPTGTAVDWRNPAPVPAAPGQVIAVWGPTGAPGRSMVAAGLADALSGHGHGTLLIDADVYGGVLANAFGVLDESPGLAGACRAAANGRLNAAELDKLAWTLHPTLKLLSGIARADRWPELRPSAVPQVLAAARALAPVTVVDCGFCLEADEELSFDTMAPRRNGATLAMLAEADQVLAVGAADPAGMVRLIRGLDELSEAVPSARPRVVVNRIRPGGGSGDQALAALRRFAGVADVVKLPEDRAAMDLAWQRGQALSVVAPKSALRSALAALAGQLVSSRAPASRR